MSPAPAPVTSSQNKDDPLLLPFCLRFRRMSMVGIYLLFVVKKEEGLLLSEEDRKLLEKWKTMQSQPASHARTGSDGAPDVKIFTHARTASSGSNISNVSDGASPKPSTVIPTVHQIQGHSVQQGHPVQQGHSLQQGYPSVQPGQDPGYLVQGKVKVKVEPTAAENIRTQFSSNVPPVIQQSSGGALPGNNVAMTTTTTAVHVKPAATNLSQVPYGANVSNANGVTTNFQAPATAMNNTMNAGVSFMPFGGVSGNAAPGMMASQVVAPGPPTRPPPGFPQLPLGGVVPPAGTGAGVLVPPPPGATGTTLPSYDEALQAKMSSIVKQPMVHTFGTNTAQQQQQLPRGGVAEEAKNLNYGHVPDSLKKSSAHRNVVTFSEETQDSPPVPRAPASSPQVGSTSIIAGLPASMAAPPVTPSSQQTLPANWLNMLTQKMFRSHVEDLTLAQTPKGTGAGYGLGVDIDAIIRETEAADTKDVEG